jgi:D-glycero-alpha-D-manno-heptose 1-phosphate guanylyltransferase
MPDDIKDHPLSASAYPPAIILAGGYGMRVRELYPDLPKPMIPVSGRPFIAHLVEYLVRLGIPEVYISTGYKGNKIEEYFAPSDSKVFCIQESEVLGTGGAVALVLSQIKHGDVFLVMNGDSLSPVNLTAMLTRLPKADAVVAATTVPDSGRYGTLCIDASGFLKGFHEKKQTSAAGLVNAGVYLLRRSLFPELPPSRPISLESGYFPEWIAAGKHIAVTANDAPFLDIGTPESLNMADAFLRQASFLKARATA